MPNFVALATASDCNGVIVTQVPAAGAFVGLGATNVVCTATDGAGNTSSCTVLLTVVDTTPPSITACAAPLTLPPGPACASPLLPDLTGSVLASDNCGSVTITQSPVAGFALPLGPKLVTFTVTDSNGNTATCSALVTVVDMAPPTLTCPPTANVTTAALRDPPTPACRWSWTTATRTRRYPSRMTAAV